MKKSLLNIEKAIEEVGRALLKNRVVMIICVFIIFFVVVGGINFMQKKTMEHFSYSEDYIECGNDCTSKANQCSKDDIKSDSSCERNEEICFYDCHSKYSVETHISPDPLP